MHHRTSPIAATTAAWASIDSGAGTTVVNHETLRLARGEQHGERHVAEADDARGVLRVGGPSPGLAQQPGQARRTVAVV